jgi:hypothetical protein
VWATKTSLFALREPACRCGTGSCPWWTFWSSCFDVKHKVITPYHLLNGPQLIDTRRDSTLSDTNNSTAVEGTGIFATFHAQNNTGLSLTSSTLDLVRAYYIDGDNQIIKAEYLNKTWLSPGGEPHIVTNITSQAVKGSPIAAVTYNFNDGAQHRQIFFYDTDGLVATTYATNDGAWSEVYNPFPEITKYPGAEGLAACVAPTMEA